jgi:hypothetical protein
MKLKTGKELNQLEIIKRLNIMGIDYNSDIIGKNYYIDLYDKAIKSKLNLEKIKLDLEKDKMYNDFYNQKLRRRKECSFEIKKEKSLSNNNSKNSKGKYMFKENISNGNNKYFEDFNFELAKNIFLAKIFLNTYEYANENPNKFKNIYSIFNIPIQAFKKFSMINIYPEFKKGLINIFEIFDDVINDKFEFIIYLLFFIIIIILLIFIKKRNKK